MKNFIIILFLITITSLVSVQAQDEPEVDCTSLFSGGRVSKQDVGSEKNDDDLADLDDYMGGFEL